LDPHLSPFYYWQNFAKKRKFKKIENEVLLGGFKSPELRKKNSKNFQIWLNLPFKNKIKYGFNIWMIITEAT
jgi:hypothetical protein